MARPRNEVTQELKNFLDLCEKASARSRYVLIALIFATVVMFGGMWKQAPFSWFDSDLNIRLGADYLMRVSDALKDAQKQSASCRKVSEWAREMLDDGVPVTPRDAAARTPRNLQIDGGSLGACGDIPPEVALRTIVSCATPGSGPAGKPASAAVAREAACRELKELRFRVEGNASKQEEQIKSYQAILASDELKTSRFFVDRARRSRTDVASEGAARDRVQKELEERRRVRSQHEALVQMPLFGVTFHINDLGILGGFTIFVLLLWMRAALDEEVNGLQITKGQILGARDDIWPTPPPEDEEQWRKERGDFLRKMYELLSMQQFFFRPQPLDGKDERFGSRALRYAVIGLICLPVLIEGALFLTDLWSESFIFLANKGGYLSTLIASGAFLSLNAMLTSFAVSSAMQQVKVWREIAQEFGPARA